MNLERLGATAELRASLCHIAPDLTLARVTFSHRERYRLIADCGDLDAEPAGALWVISSAGGWTSQTFVGSGGDAGKQFQILAVTADAAAVNTITGYLARAHQSGNYPGLPQLPAGARLYDKVPVIRQGGPAPSPSPSGPVQ